MSNEIQVKYTKFTNLDSNGNEVGTMYGVRIYDEFENFYSNTWDDFDSLVQEINPETIVDYVKSIYNEYESDMFDLDDPLYFNGELIETEQEED